MEKVLEILISIPGMLLIFVFYNLWIFIALYIAKFIWFKIKSRKAIGKIIGFTKVGDRPRSKGGIIYSPVIEFMSENGKTYRTPGDTELSKSDIEKPGQIGQEVKVAYVVMDDGSHELHTSHYNWNIILILLLFLATSYIFYVLSHSHYGAIHYLGALVCFVVIPILLLGRHKMHKIRKILILITHHHSKTLTESDPPIELVPVNEKINKKSISNKITF